MKRKKTGPLSLGEARRIYANLTEGYPPGAVPLTWNFFRIGIRLAQKGSVSRADEQWIRGAVLLEDAK